MSISIGWVLSGDRTKASSRLQGYVIHDWLLKQHIKSEILADKFNDISGSDIGAATAVLAKMYAAKVDVIVFEAPEWMMTQIAQVWRTSGKPAVAVRCDYIPSEYDKFFDLTILPTQGLADSLSVRNRVIIPDMVEVPEDRYKADFSHQGKIKVAWVGHHSYESYITTLVARLRENPEIERQFEFVLISKGSFATKQWSEQTVVDDILSCDIAFLPIPEGEWYRNKSSNRLAMMFSLAMPVVATMIPSYAVLAQEGKNGTYCDKDAEFAEKLLSLIDVEKRKSFGQTARMDLGDQFSMHRICKEWLSAIESARPSTTPVTLGKKARLMAILGRVKSIFK